MDAQAFLDQVKNLEQRRSELRSQVHALEMEKETLLRSYQEQRRDLFQQALQERELTWCTYCKEAASIKTCSLIYTHGVEYFEGGYQNSDYGFRKFANLFRACKPCGEALLSRDGRYGPYDRFAEAQTVFHAERAEERDGVFYLLGGKVEIRDKLELNSRVPEEVIAKFAKEFGLPPRIDKDVWGQRGEFVVYET